VWGSTALDMEGTDTLGCNVIAVPGWAMGVGGITVSGGSAIERM
jgi:hypothetical protein